MFVEADSSDRQDLLHSIVCCKKLLEYSNAFLRKEGPIEAWPGLESRSIKSCKSFV